MITRLLTRLLTVHDEPYETASGMYFMDRRWRWWPAFTRWNGRVCVGVELQMMRFKGVEQAPRTVGDWRIGFVYDPRKWKIERMHGYYDGPHCAWQFGPFELCRDSLGWCKTCMPDDGVG